MRAVRLENIESLPAISQVPTPRPERGQITVNVAACGLNFADLLTMKGQYQERPPLPMTLGMEISGTVREIGPDVDGFHVGQRVAAFTGMGGLAEVALCPAERCIALPDDMTMTDAAGFLVAYGTSHLALGYRARLQRDETLVVLGAAGGVGLTAVEIGVQMGARVIAVARGEQKLQVAKQAGAAICLDSDTTDLRRTLKDLGGVDVVYDAVGEPMASEALRALRPEGRFLAIGFAGGKVPQFPANILLVKNLTVIGLYWGGYLNFAPTPLTDSLRELFDWYAQGRLKPHVSHVLPFDQVFEGFELLRNRKSTGKIVISMQ
ncbi:NADPH:quinone oxidoreductase family protein [Roseinatronobacter sp. S2]|uniref:NADPH:quinone oxidoreductase family protein n=1 Tax=Roseinatronobacter sp. S2 TaxID=3035471 RepID=UPI002410821A|nr:NADPH:quinone oxidoreductase family protein [Roseinatronobacter sp. S2]WFE76067.1 NADPH:quinone oxidoreductase family protein [Roseinatronobacter sp. S2]